MNFRIGEVEIGLDAPLFLMAGPCVIESKTSCINIANRLRDISQKTGVGIIFKASFDKANRSSLRSFRGPGLQKADSSFSMQANRSSLRLCTNRQACQC